MYSDLKFSNQTKFSKFAQYLTICSDNNAAILCESEAFKIVKSDEDGFRIDDETTVVYDKDGTKEGKPFVGEDWIKIIAKVVDTSIKEVAKFDTNFIECFPDQSEKDITDFALEIIENGPDTFSLMEDMLTKNSFLSDFSACDEDVNVEGYYDLVRNEMDLFILSFSLVVYWKRQGYELDCPLADLMADFANMDLFSLFPVINPEHLEELRPSLKICKESYPGKGSSWIIFQIKKVLGIEYLEENDNDSFNKTSWLFLINNIIDEEWPKELEDDSDEESEGNEEEESEDDSSEED